jgi:hypothetical protein
MATPQGVFAGRGNRAHASNSPRNRFHPAINKIGIRPASPQVSGRSCCWWRVMDSNQRRLCRRFTERPLQACHLQRWPRRGFSPRSSPQSSGRSRHRPVTAGHRPGCHRSWSRAPGGVGSVRSWLEHVGLHQYRDAGPRRRGRRGSAASRHRSRPKGVVEDLACIAPHTTAGPLVR